MIRIENLTQKYGGTQILWGLDLELKKGQCSCIMGRNGVGKTTLLKCIMGLLPVSGGKIIYDGVEIQKQAAETRAHQGIGYVPQGRDIFPLLSVEENLLIGLQSRNDGLTKIPDRIYDLFPVLKDMLERRGGDLSGGQQQQLAIGRALVTDPKVLILDEPNEGIQPNIVQQIGDVITELNQEDGLTVVLVEQKLGFARRVGDSFTLIEKGAAVASGDMIDLNDDLIGKHLAV